MGVANNTHPIAASHRLKVLPQLVRDFVKAKVSHEKCTPHDAGAIELLWVETTTEQSARSSVRDARKASRNAWRVTGSIARVSALKVVRDHLARRETPNRAHSAVPLCIGDGRSPQILDTPAVVVFALLLVPMLIVVATRQVMLVRRAARRFIGRRRERSPISILFATVRGPVATRTLASSNNSSQ